MSAKLILRDKYIYADSAIREMVIWRLPKADKEWPHGLEYSLFYGYLGKSLLRYDTEEGKGGHRHLGDLEAPYRFISVEQLIQDFRADIEQMRGESEG